MSLEDWLESGNEVVDPEVRAYVGSLVNAVGGISIENHGKYMLGDDAVGCLKDMRRWLRFYDEKLDRLDVQRVLAESNFVKGDVLEILADWPDNNTNSSFHSKISLLCLELLVPLTWTLEIEDKKMTVHHHKHVPYLRLAQVEYKRAILQHESHKIIRQIIRIALPSMAEPKKDRSVRDNGIIRLVLYGIRNIAIISQPEDLTVNGDESEISRAMTIKAFHQQDVFQFLLTIASSLGEDFDVQDVVVLEVLFHLIKGIEPSTLFKEDEELAQTKTNELRTLLSKEKSMLSGYKKYAPTRHSRFGTMVWLKKDDEKISTISGQAAISWPNRGLQHLNTAKKWNKPKYGARKQEIQGSANFDKAVAISGSSRKHLRHFVEEFLDSSFNPLFMHIRRSMERELDRVVEMHYMQYFYLVNWFLNAQCARGEHTRAKRSNKGKQKEGTEAPFDSDGFSIIAGVLNQETFVLLNRFLDSSFERKSWQNVNACMKCFSQVLLTVQQMEQSSDEDDQEIAENIQNRIFYENSTLDLILKLLRNYKDQGLGYLDAVTQLSHVFLRMLESYSKQNEDMQIRSKRRTKKKTQQAMAGNSIQENETENEQGHDHGNESEDEAQAAKIISKERKFSFQKFATRFSTQNCVDTFIAFIKGYQDLSADQLKRAHRYLYRVAFKLDMCTMLFRLDIIQLLHNMLRGPAPLSRESPLYKDWEELARQVFKKLTRTLKDRPELMVEMLFSKIPSTAYYLEHGHDVQIAKLVPKPLAEWEVKSQISKSDRISLVTEALVAEHKHDDALKWIKNELERAVTERRKWEDGNSAREAANDLIAEGEESFPDTDTLAQQNKPPIISFNQPSIQLQKEISKNPKLRLLLSLFQLERAEGIDGPEATYIVPSSLTCTQLQDALKKMSIGEAGQALQSYPDAKPAALYLRRKPNAVSSEDRYNNDGGHVALSSDSEGNDSFDELLLRKGLTTGHADIDDDDADQPKKKKKHRSSGHERRKRSEEERRRLAKEKRLREKEKLRKIKSDVFIHASDDDEWDEEKDRAFYKREEDLRAEMGSIIAAAVQRAEKSGQKKSQVELKRKEMSSDDDDDDDNDEDADGDSSCDDESEQRRKRKRISVSDDGESSDEEAVVEKLVVDISSDDDEDDEEDDNDNNEFGKEDTLITLQSVSLAKDESVDENKENQHYEDIDMDDSDDGMTVSKGASTTKTTNEPGRGGFAIFDSDSE